MKKCALILLTALILTGCSNHAQERGYDSRFTKETLVVLSDDGITVDGGEETKTVFTSRDIQYYEDRDTYPSGNPYGEGQEGDKHSKEEAQEHTVVNIAAPGAYRLSGKLTRGQIRIDLGKDAKKDEMAVVELVLDGAEISCTVAPAIVFRNVYECDADGSKDTARSKVNTSLAGANLILLGENTVSGSHVAKIFKDKEGGKKELKQDGAIYSYMSMNLSGSGKLTLNADNEGIGTEMHLTVTGGDVAIRSQNDGINANEDDVSVITIEDGRLRILAGLGAEGDGIDSNGYLVVNGGDVAVAGRAASDHGLDSSLGTYLNGGTIVAFGEPVETLSKDSKQAVLDLEFPDRKPGTIQIKDGQGESLFFFDPAQDPVLKEDSRKFWTALVSCPALKKGKPCQVLVSGQDVGLVAPQ